MFVSINIEIERKSSQKSNVFINHEGKKKKRNKAKNETLARGREKPYKIAK